jgi:hypothetical protein
MFSLPPSDRGIEGGDDQNPIILEAVDKVDFERLMRVMFPE